MRICILKTIIVALTLLHLLHAEPTILSYVVQHQIDDLENYVEITLSVHAEGKSLQHVIKQTERVIENIQQIAIAHCMVKAKNQKECDDIVQVSKYKVEPKYHLVRKIETFTLFILGQQVVITAKNLKGLGKMIDMIVKEGGQYVTLTDFVWKAQEESDPEISALKQGIQQGKQLCERIGMKLTQFVEVKELQLPQEQQQEQEQVDEDLAQIQPQINIFRFKVKCNAPTKQKKK